MAALKTFVLAAILCVSAPTDAREWIFESGFDHAQEGPTNARDAARFLTQASFGPTLHEIDRLMAMGYDAWLDEQMQLPASLQTPWLLQLEAGGEEVYQGQRYEAWYRNAVSGPDQLRQRVAFALSQTLVVSDQSGALEGVAIALAHYYDQLVTGGLGNYRDLLEDITLSPVMGHYLSMFKNRKPDPALNTRPDENFAREVLQLFSIGLWQMREDGVYQVQCPGGLPPGSVCHQDLYPTQPRIPSYGQDQIRGFAHVFTGWNFSRCTPPNGNGSNPGFNIWNWTWCDPEPGNSNWRTQVGWREPMKPWGEGTAFGAVMHAQSGSKTLLNYPGVSLPNGVLPAGGTARANLGAALDNIFHHPNLGPFLARALIQRLVTSNPSPAYIGRVAAVFNDDNGNTPGGVRGNLQATVRSVLMDPEARHPHLAPETSGKVREPLLRITQLWRAMAAQPVNGRWPDWPLDYAAQAPLGAPSVFNFYSPGYSPTGMIANAGLVAPEFQITTDTYITRLLNNVSGKVSWYWQGNPGISGSWRPPLIDLARDLPLVETPAALVDRYSLLFLHGEMPLAMRALLIAHAESIPLSWNGITPAQVQSQRRARLTDVLWLILSSPAYVVEK